jgi:transaldolase
VEALAAPDTINTLPPATLHAFAARGRVDRTLPNDGVDADEMLVRFEHAGVNLDALAEELQRDGARAFVKSWDSLIRRITAKAEALSSTHP